MKKNRFRKILLIIFLLIFASFIFFKVKDVVDETQTRKEIEKVEYVDNPTLFLRRFTPKEKNRTEITYYCDSFRDWLCYYPKPESSYYPYTYLDFVDRYTSKDLKRLQMLVDKKWNVFWIQVNENEIYGPYKSDFQTIDYTDLPTETVLEVITRRLEAQFDVQVLDKKIIILEQKYQGGRHVYSSKAKYDGKIIYITINEEYSYNPKEKSVVEDFKTERNTTTVDLSTLPEGEYEVFIETTMSGSTDNHISDPFLRYNGKLIL